MTDITAVASENTTPSPASAVIDHSYWPHPGKNEAEGAGSVDMSFNDFIDMVNPLQHIPIVSSLYRAATGETINPVSHIVGDTIYNGPFGLVSAGITALGTIGDEIISASNNGKSISQTVVASLFGNGKEETKLAQNTPQNSAPQTTKVAALEPSKEAAAAPSVPPSPLAATLASAAAPAPTSAPSPSSQPQLAANSPSKGLTFDRSKMPYGGVMDSSMMQSAQQNQTLAMAMAGQNGIMQANRTLRSNRFATAPTTATKVATTDAPSSPTPALADSVQATAEPQTQQAMQGLLQELQSMKGLNQYKNAAQMTPIPGGTVNITN